MSKNEIEKVKNQLETRSKILTLQEELMKYVDGENIVAGDTEVFPLKHTFTD